MTETTSHHEAFARLEALCQSRGLDDVARGKHQNGPALSALGGIFAHLPDPNTLALACPVDQKVLLLDIDPEIYFETESEIGKPLVLIRLSAISDEELSLRLDDAWTLFASEDLVRRKTSGADGA